MARSGSSIPSRGKIHTQGLKSLALRFLVAVDVEGFSERNVAEQARAQDGLELAMADAAESSGLQRERWYRQPSGDGELAVLPPTVDGLALVDDFPRELASAVANINHANRGTRLRLRLAIHHGAVVPGRFGPVGRALIVISRLVDSEVTREQLRQRSDLDVALIASATVYDEVIQSRLHNLDPDAFRRVTVRAKKISYIGYVRQTSLWPPESEVRGAREPMLRKHLLRPLTKAVASAMIGQRGDNCRDVGRRNSDGSHSSDPMRAGSLSSSAR